MWVDYDNSIELTNVEHETFNIFGTEVSLSFGLSPYEVSADRSILYTYPLSLGESYMKGIEGGGRATIDYAYNILTLDGDTWLGYYQGMASMATGLWVQDLVEATQQAAEIAPKLDNNDIAYGAGYLTEKTLEAIILRRAARAKGPSSKNPKTVTERLQSYVNKAAKQVDEAGDKAFTPKQLSAMKRKPYLRPMFRGNRIDVKTRQLMKDDPNLRHLEGRYTNGPDFRDPSSGNWWDITTQGAWQSHVRKYGAGGTLLDTKIY